MARWLLALVLVSGSAIAQVPQDAPMTAADAAAKARGADAGTANEPTPRPGCDGKNVDGPCQPTTPGSHSDAYGIAPGAMPSRAAAQAVEDRCPANEPDCAKKPRDPAPPGATPPSTMMPSEATSPSTDLLGSTLVGTGSPAQHAPGGLASAAAVPSHPIELSAYFILGGQWVQQDPNYLYVGRNNGFSLGDARLEVTGRPSDSLWLFLSLDGAVANRSATDPSQGNRIVALKDAYGVYSPGFHIRIEAGQFKAPQDVEHLLEETEIKFPSRSLLTDGLHTPAGYETNGLSLDRQIGIAIGTDVIPLPFGSIAAQVMVSNGNGPNTLFNNTSMPGVIGRVAIGLFKYVSLGGDAYFMPEATGTQPDLFRDDWYGAGGDIRVEWNGVHFMALLQWRDTEHITSGAPDEHALGYTIEGAYRLPGVLSFLEPAVRYGMLNPSDKLIDPSGGYLAQIESIDAALNFYAPGAGNARLSLSYVHRMEDQARTLQNDGLDMSLQVSF